MDKAASGLVSMGEQRQCPARRQWEAWPLSGGRPKLRKAKFPMFWELGFNALTDTSALSPAPGLRWDWKPDTDSTERENKDWRRFKLSRKPEHSWQQV
jgi:hypothetical protein